MKLTDEVYRLELPGGGAYLILGQRHVLIDTGMPGRDRRLLMQLDEILPAAHALDEVLLTHHDVDHIGNLRAVQERYAVRAYIGGADMPYATGVEHRPGVKRVIEAVLRPQTPAQLLPLEQYGNPEIRAIPMPGHTPGHTVFQYRTFLFTGDLFHTKKGHITPTKRVMNWDNRVLSRSIEKMMVINARTLCPAHGDPIDLSESVREELKEIGDYYAGKSRN